jgi:hypothetical protein
MYLQKEKEHNNRDPLLVSQHALLMVMLIFSFFSLLGLELLVRHVVHNFP